MSFARLIALTRKPMFYFISAIILMVIIFGFGLSKCDNRSDDIAKQIEQSNKSSEAFGDATNDAVNRIGERFATESTIDDAVQQVKDKIGNAKTTDDIRGAVIDSLCRKPSHRDDPACAVRQLDPG